MPNRQRNEEAQFQCFVNGERIVGLKVRVRSWSITANMSVEANEYTGELDFEVLSGLVQ